jgi:hypothetical protein
MILVPSILNVAVSIETTVSVSKSPLAVPKRLLGGVRRFKRDSEEKEMIWIELWYTNTFVCLHTILYYT